MSALGLVKELLPRFVRLPLLRLRAKATLRANADRSPKDIFGEIYQNRAWSAPDDKRYDFDSGPGSAEYYAVPYIDAIREFSAAHNLASVVDLGCGDFRVGRLLAPHFEKYVGVDVVDALIERNRRLYASERIDFLCRDIINEQIPRGDLCLVRQVFQHLSNAQISGVLPKLAQFRYCIVTDSQPLDIDGFRPNLDKPAGVYSTAYFHSGLRLDRPPFNLANVRTFLEIKHAENPELMIRSFLLDFDQR